MAEPEPTGDAELLATVTARRPELIDLARLASVAAIVEPALLRRLRQQLLPGLDAGIEADLWFSPLTHVASAAAWTMRTGVATLLRAQLGLPTYRSAAHAARAIVAETHAGHSDMLRLEDTIIWESVLGHDQGVEQAFHRVLATLDTSPQLAPELIRWFGQAQRRVPPATLTSRPASRLSAIAALHVDRIVPDSILDADRLPDGLGAAAPTTLPITRVSVELVESGLRFDTPETGDGALITLPQTRPLVLEVRWPGTSSEPRTRVVRAEPATEVSLPDVRDEVVLRTLAGTRYRLARITAPLSLDQALEMLQSFALTFHMRRFFNPEISDEPAQRQVLGLSDEQDWHRYEHVRRMAEYFTEPVRYFLEGRENPLSRPVEPETTESPASADEGSILSSFPGIEDTGLDWPTFHAYLTWLIDRLRGYIATIVDRLGPRMIQVGFAVTDDVWRAAWARVGPDALPEASLKRLISLEKDAPERFTYDVERAAVPGLIDVLAAPILDAVAAAEVERPPPPALVEEPPVPGRYVFIGFARQDAQEAALSLRDELLARKVSVGPENQPIEPGQSLRRAIEAAVKSSRMVVLLVTPNFLQSEWTRIEVAAAIKRPDSARAIFPILYHIGVEEVLGTFPALAGRQFLVLDERSTPAHLADLIAETFHAWDAQ